MSSALGKALGMDDTYTWAQVVTALTGVATKTSGSQSVTTSGKWGFSLNDGAWLYIPTNGYYTTSHWLNIPWNTIKSSLGTANTGQVLSGYTFTSQNGIKLSGSMANRSSTIQTATTDTSNQSKSCYRINGSNIEVVPAVGYWGNWDWTKSCIRVPASSVANISDISAFTWTTDWYEISSITKSGSLSGGIYVVVNNTYGASYMSTSFTNATVITTINKTGHNGNYPYTRVYLIRVSSTTTVKTVSSKPSNAYSNSSFMFKIV